MLGEARGGAFSLFAHAPVRGRGRCYGACASTWPPYLGRGVPQGRDQVVQAKLGTVTRRDGAEQVTYAGHTLYYYVGDRKPGQVLCQAATEYGGTWDVIRARRPPRPRAR